MIGTTYETQNCPAAPALDLTLTDSGALEFTPGCRPVSLSG
jgi:hypothetical protein